MITTENISDIDTWDTATDTRIETLNAEFQNTAKEIILRANDRHGIQLRITQALRTNEEQNNLYAQGRTQTQLNNVGLNHVTAQPNAQIVTNARGGQSLHNYGVAIDVVPIVNGTADWNSTEWNNIGEIGVRAGASWGGNWTNFVDLPHFDTGQTLEELQNGN
ncbi:M15 family metallopeptidase [Flexithrix dorotheae]|uniref:M15 family metallopeptidase n=1 Tax=Flexithrix dorotheae TaxID=70993 RepID=UPI00248140D8|nr:M15 family metallopeptidase [Flexithrix dorotheae]